MARRHTQQWILPSKRLCEPCLPASSCRQCEFHATSYRIIWISNYRAELKWFHMTCVLTLLKKDDWWVRVKKFHLGRMRTLLACSSPCGRLFCGRVLCFDLVGTDALMNHQRMTAMIIETRLWDISRPLLKKRARACAGHATYFPADFNWCLYNSQLIYSP